MSNEEMRNTILNALLHDVYENANSFKTETGMRGR